MGTPSGTEFLLLALFLIVLAIVWILLPFAIFGTKPKLDAIAAQQRETNQHLADILAALRGMRSVESSANPAAVALGECPNCKMRLPLNAYVCLNCATRFGPDSTWKVKPISA